MRVFDVPVWTKDADAFRSVAVAVCTTGKCEHLRDAARRDAFEASAAGG